MPRYTALLTLFSSQTIHKNKQYNTALVLLSKIFIKLTFSITDNNVNILHIQYLYLLGPAGAGSGVPGIFCICLLFKSKLNIFPETLRCIKYLALWLVSLTCVILLKALMHWFCFNADSFGLQNQKFLAPVPPNRCLGRRIGLCLRVYVKSTGSTPDEKFWGKLTAL